MAMTKGKAAVEVSRSFGLYSVQLNNGTVLKDMTACKLAASVHESKIRYLAKKLVDENGVVSKPTLVTNVVATMAACRKRLAEVKSQEDQGANKFLASLS